MKNIMITILVVGGLTVGAVAECRVGGGRSFGSRGMRGFSPPTMGYRNSPYRSNNIQTNRLDYPQQQPGGIINPGQTAGQRPSLLGSSFMKSMAAGMAGSFLGNMLFRSLGGGGYGYSEGAPGRGGFGVIELLFLGGLLYLLYKLFLSRSETITSPSPTKDQAALLMKQARYPEWDSPQPNVSYSSSDTLDASSMSTDLAMDLFFQIQGAWGNRDLSSVNHLIDAEAKTFLDQEITRLKSARQINRLENIAVRSTEVLEAWQESGKEYSTIRFTANLLDFTIDEQTQQIVDGSKNTPVKFEEFWTFSKDMHSSNWKLSAIMQS